MVCPRRRPVGSTWIVSSFEEMLKLDSMVYPRVSVFQSACWVTGVPRCQDRLFPPGQTRARVGGCEATAAGEPGERAASTGRGGARPETGQSKRKVGGPTEREFQEDTLRKHSTVKPQRGVEITSRARKLNTDPSPPPPLLSLFYSEGCPLSLFLLSLSVSMH